MRAPDEEHATRYLDGCESTTNITVDHVMSDAWEAWNSPWNRLGSRSIDSWPIQPSTVVGEPRTSHEDTTNPSEHERQVAEVGREDTSSECVKPCVVGSEVMAVSVKSPDPVGVRDLGCGNSTDPRPVGESGLRSLEG